MPSKKNRSKSRRCGLTAEGWVYIVIICFISMGAVLRNVNLLILSTGMLVAPLIFNWRVCVANMRSLKAKRVVPERIHAQSSVNIAWTCDNSGGRLSARNIILHDKINAQHDNDSRSLISSMIQRVKNDGKFGERPQKEKAHVSFSAINQFDPGIASYKCYFPGRGQYSLGPAEIRTSFPFGLVACRIPLSKRQQVFVAPPLGKLHPTWEKRIDSTEVGNQSRTRRKGLEMDEFYALRRWRSGDSQKHIHWRSSAKMGFPMVKEFDQTNDRDFALLLDLYSHDDATRLDCEIILSFAATALAQISSDVQGKLGLAICGAENELVSGLQSRETYKNAMQKLAVAQASDSPEVETSAIDLAATICSGTPLYCLSTRDEPQWLSGNESQTSPALDAVRNQIRWIHVESDEFKDLFSIEFNSAANSNEQATMT